MFTRQMDTDGGHSSEAMALKHLAERLQRQYALPAEVIHSAIAEAVAGFSGRPIRDFVPILVEREALDRLGRPERRDSID